MPELSSSAPYVGDNEGLVRVTRSEHLDAKMVPKSKLPSTRQRSRLSVIGSTWWVKTVAFSHCKSLSQWIDTWQPTDREGTTPPGTELTLDQLLTWFNGRKSSNNATPKWNNRIYPKLYEAHQLQISSLRLWVSVALILNLAQMIQIITLTITYWKIWSFL